MKPVSMSLNFIHSSAHLLSLSLIRSFLWDGDTACVFTGSWQTKVCSLDVSKQLPCPWRKHGICEKTPLTAEHLSLHVVGDDNAVGGYGHIWQYLALLHPEPLLPSLG